MGQLPFDETEHSTSPSVPRVFDPASAAAFIDALFRFMLDRVSPGDEEKSYWTKFLLDNQDPVDILTRFGESGEFKNRMTGLRDANRGFPPGHFYSPIVNTDEVKEDEIRLFGPRSTLGIDLNVKGQKETFKTISGYAGSMPFNEEPTPGLRYYFNNTSYAFGDAFAYWGMIGSFKPKRIIEIGSGFTSALILDAIEHFKLSTLCSFVDPYPALLLRVADPIAKQHSIIADRVQNVNPTIVDSLGYGDILFIDSSHVVKTGSDVHYELTKLLPRLASGVIVHFHDVFDGFEYPKAWVLEAGQSWNEIYFLQAFLMYNKDFKLIYFNDFFAKQCTSELDVLSEDVRKRIWLNPGGGLWMQKV